MKLQNLLVIFVIIALPVIIILTVFINYQIDTARLKSTYSSKLIDATYDTVAAFQLNVNNDKYSTITDSLMEDIQASSNIFAKTLASNLGIAGANQSRVMANVPALLYTLYDGYYIYTPVKQPNGEFVHEIKPYVYYTKTYTVGTKILTINFSLDNYVAVYYYNRNTYQSRAGYLDPWATNPNGNTYRGCNITDSDAKNYYKDANNFTNWFNEILKNDFGVTSDVYKKLYISTSNSPLQGADSAFNKEKTDVIETSITNNLKQAMNMYGELAGKNFRAPELTRNDWDTILNNICVISFMQGLPTGTSVFNDYAIITSTDNSMYVNDNTLYFIGSDDLNTYHRIGCPLLSGTTITGYNKSEFKRKQLEENGTITYTYPNPANACYSCVVHADDASLPQNATPVKKAAYYTAIAKEKYKLIKISDYINNSGKIPE